MQENARRKGDSVLLTALAAGATVRDAAKRAGINEATAHRRLQDVGFRQEVAIARAALVDNALGQLADASTAAVCTPRAPLGAEGESVRLGAARAILELGTKLRESVEFEQRISRLEEAAQ